MKPPLAGLLLAWYRKAHRDLPWRRTSDPYRVWVSEIMLQQTRAQTVIPYYLRFLERFPTASALAAADEDSVLALWSGLGYYSRARGLWKAAREIAARSVFPRCFEELRELPGIGDYTAAAIASIAFGEPRAAVDGNVLRVVARVQNDSADIGASATRERFRAIAQQWLDPSHAGEFNQALMELGATVCLPRNPLCRVCPLAELCRALQQGTATELPVKLRTQKPVEIEAVLLAIVHRGRVLLRRRDASARHMPGFWDLPSPEDLPGARLGEMLGEFRHTITHHHFHFRVLAAERGERLGRAVGFRWMRPADLAAVPLATTARKALRIAGFPPAA